MYMYTYLDQPPLPPPPPKKNIHFLNWKFPASFSSLYNYMLEPLSGCMGTSSPDIGEQLDDFDVLVGVKLVKFPQFSALGNLPDLVRQSRPNPR